jgi:hypothetical protein
VPVKVIGSVLGIQFFDWNMHRLGRGLKSDPYASVPYDHGGDDGWCAQWGQRDAQQLDVETGWTESEHRMIRRMAAESQIQNRIACVQIEQSVATSVAADREW